METKEKIQIQIKNSHAQIQGLTDLPIIDAISNELSYKESFIPRGQRFKWDGTHRLLTKKQKFPSGCLNRVTGVLDAQGIPYSLQDWREYNSPNPDSDGLLWRGHDLYDYQNKIVERCIDQKKGMIKAATGSGKTLIIARLAYEYNLPTVIYVVSTDLLEQMHRTLSDSLTLPIGIVGDGKCDIQKITVCSAWSAGRAYNKKNLKADEDVRKDNWSPSQEQRAAIREMVEGARLAILDEAQFAAADSIKAILSNSHSAAHRYGFTGTPWRTDGDDILLEAAFGRRICDLTATELIREGYLVPAHFVFKDIPKALVEVDKSWRTIKSEYIVDNPIRNQILINSTKMLLEMGRKPLLLFREHRHGEMLRDMLPPDIRYRYVTGKVKSAERKEIRQDFLNGDVDLILASTVYDQGIDLPPLDALVLAAGGKSTAKALQRVGRVIRSFKDGGKKDAIIVDTFDQAKHARKHSYGRYLIYETEEAFKFKIPSNFQSYIKRMSRYDKERYLPQY
jgi:superfamily II DNA or RNA helicase